MSPVDTFDNTRQIMKVAERLIKRGELPDDYYKFRRELSKYNVNPSQGRELNKSTSQTKFVFENVRTGKAVGGEVDVPRAAPEPDERIDKMTGLPYNIQAGIPFRDEEDPIKRLGLAGGSMAVDPMQRLGFAAGGVRKGVEAVIKTKEKVSENVLEAIEQGENFAYQALKYLVEGLMVAIAAFVIPAKRLKLDECIYKFAESGKILFGICLGMQLLFDNSDEFGSNIGLGIIKGRTQKFNFNNNYAKIYPVPQIGWNRIYENNISWSGTILNNNKKGDYMYFLHSNYVLPLDNEIILSNT